MTGNKIQAGYQLQLWNNLHCSEINLPQLDKTDYSLENLKEIFIDYNECKNVNYIVYKEKSKKGKFKIGLKAGVNFTNFHLYQDGYYHYHTE